MMVTFLTCQRVGNTGGIRSIQLTKTHWVAVVKNHKTSQQIGPGKINLTLHLRALHPRGGKSSNQETPQEGEFYAGRNRRDDKGNDTNEGTFTQPAPRRDIFSLPEETAAGCHQEFDIPHERCSAFSLPGHDQHRGVAKLTRGRHSVVYGERASDPIRTNRNLLNYHDYEHFSLYASRPRKVEGAVVTRAIQEVPYRFIPAAPCTQTKQRSD